MIDEDYKKEVNQMIDQKIKSAVKFSQRKVGDTPTDDNQLTPRGYVNMYGSIASRPNSSIAQIGQQYFVSDVGYPIFFSTNHNWVSATGSVVASN